MKISLFSKNKKIVNLVFTDNFIRFVELKQTSPIAVHNWGERALPPGIIANGKIIDAETLLMILEQCVDDWKIAKRSVRFLVPEAAVIIRKVSIPADVREDEIKGYLYLELGSSIHLPFEEPIFDIVKLGDVNGKQEILIFAAQTERVMEYSELLSDAKLHPIAAEISPLSLYRLYHHEQQESKDEHLLLVQIDTHMVNISIFDDHIPVFMHHIPYESIVNGQNLQLLDTEKSTSPSGVTSQTFNDLFKEMDRLMDFYRYSLHQDKKQITNILLTGDNPRLQEVLALVSARYEIPVQQLQPKKLKELELPFTLNVALGLAIKEV